MLNARNYTFCTYSGADNVNFVEELEVDASSSAISRLDLDERCATVFARTLGVISARLLDGGLIDVLGSGEGMLTTARTRRQLRAAGRVGLRVVAFVTSGSYGWGADLERQAAARRW